MNYLGHTYVALAPGEVAVEDEAAFVLGAVLPDLASMAGVRLEPRPSGDGPLHRGVRCHMAADAVFHAHPSFTRGSGDIRGELMAAGLDSGPARAVAHVGWELLLDGTLLGTDAESAFWRALDRGFSGTDHLVRPRDRALWADFLVRWTGRPHLRYDEPDWVADRVWTILSRRPRLSFPDRMLPVVTETLDRHHPGIRAAAPQLLDDVAWAPTA